MSKIKKKIVRYAINAQPMPPQSFEWVLFTYVQGLLSAYELVEDNEDPQLLITVNLYRSEDVFRKYTLRGVTTLSFSGESMLFKTSLLVSLVIRLQPFFSADYLRGLLYFMLRRSFMPLWHMRTIFRPHHVELLNDVLRSKPWHHTVICTTVLPGMKHLKVCPTPGFLYFTGVYEKFLAQPITSFSGQGRAKKFCVLVQSNLHKPRALLIYKTLSAYKYVDFYGKNLLATEGPLKGGDLDTSSHYGTYRFVIAVENTRIDNYISEKVMYALDGGSIPIYFGAPNVGDYINTARLVNYHDCGSYRALLARVKKLEESPDAYAEVVAQPVFTERNKENIYRARKKLRQFVEQTVEHALSTSAAENLAKDLTT